MRRPYRPLGDLFPEANPQRISELVRTLRGFDAEAREEAIEELTGMGSHIVPRMARLLNDHDERVRIPAAIILGRIGSRDAIASMIKSLPLGHEETNEQIVDSLVRIGARAVPALIAAIHTEDSDMRIGASFALSRIGEPAISDLMPVLGDTEIGADAAGILGRIGGPAVPALLGALRDDRRRANAVLGLGKTGDPRAIRPLLRMLRIRDDGLRTRVVEALGALGMRNRRHRASISRSLIPMLRESDPVLRYAAVTSLSDMGSRGAIPELQRLKTGDPEDSIREAASDAIHRIMKRSIPFRRDSDDRLFYIRTHP